MATHLKTDIEKTMVSAPESLQIIEAELNSIWPLLLHNGDFDSSRVKLYVPINTTKKNVSASKSDAESFQVQSNDGEGKAMYSSRDDLLTKLNSEIYLQRLVKNKDESMNFDESGIVLLPITFAAKGK